MYTRKGFLTGGVAIAAAGGVCGALGTTRPAAVADAPRGVKDALITPDVAFKDLQQVKMLKDGGRVYALSSRIDSISLSTVFVSPEGKILVVDGGYDLKGGMDGKFLGDFLHKLGGHVDYWFLTHAHGDHFGALATMCEKPDLYGVTIGEIIYNFPDREWMAANEPRSKPYLDKFYDMVLDRLKDVKHGDSSAGRVVNFGSWSFEILNEPFLVKKNPINNSSVMISVKAGGKTWLETGDMGVEGGRDAVKKLGARLKHDIVFLAHHGQSGADKDFYAAVKPEAAVWPTPSWLWENNRAGCGPGSGTWRTNYVKCWMQDLGVKKNYVLLKDYLFV